VYNCLKREVSQSGLPISKSTPSGHSTFWKEQNRGPQNSGPRTGKSAIAAYLTKMDSISGYCNVFRNRKGFFIQALWISHRRTGRKSQYISPGNLLRGRRRYCVKKQDFWIALDRKFL